MGGRRTGWAWKAGGALLLALALACRLAAPEGWMLAAGPDGPKLVICTGHGVATAPGHPDGHGGSSSDGHGDHACVFGGPHTPPAPSLATAAPVRVNIAYDAPAPSPLADQRPGRGLAAPPPPSHGPPQLT
jgi:hypothetical protein